MNKKKRMIADIILAVALAFCMAYSLTGGLIHEILGMLMLVGILVHVIRRRKYYTAITRVFQKSRRWQTKAAMIVNLIMIIATAMMLVTSVAISHELFAFINSGFSGYDLWRILHVIFAVVLLICVFIHVLLHAGMFRAMIRSTRQNPKAVRIWEITSVTLAVLLAILIVKVSVDNVADASELYAASRTEAVRYQVQTEISQTPEDSESKEVLASEESSVNQKETETTAIEETSEEPEETVINTEPEPSADPEVTLDDYLASLTCTGCGKRCLLISPKCGKGRTQAENATNDYYAIYQSEG